MRHKDQDNGVELEQSSADGSKGNGLVNPALANPVGQDADDSERSRGGETLEVFCLARGIVGDGASGDVETGETEESAQGERSEKELVNRGAHAEGDGCGGGRNAERDLGVVSLVLN